MKVLVVLISIGVLLLPFIPMFMIHDKRLKALKKLKYQTPDSQKEISFSLWKEHVKGNIISSNMAAFSLALFMTPHLFFDSPPVESYGHALEQGYNSSPQFSLITVAFVIGAIVFAIAAADHTSKANKLAKQIGLESGYKWIEKIVKNSSAPSSLAPPSPEEVNSRSIPSLSPQEKNLVKAVMNGASIERAAIQSEIRIEQAKAVYSAFYMAYMEQSENRRDEFLQKTIGL
jgi:hypothetical protein